MTPVPPLSLIALKGISMHRMQGIKMPLQDMPSGTLVRVSKDGRDYYCLVAGTHDPVRSRLLIDMHDPRNTLVYPPTHLVDALGYVKQFDITFH